MIAPINIKLENDDTEKHCSFSNILSSCLKSSTFHIRFECYSPECKSSSKEIPNGKDAVKVKSLDKKMCTAERYHLLFFSTARRENEMMCSPFDQ